MQEAKANIMRDAFKSWAVIARSQRKFQDTQWRTRSRRNVRYEFEYYDYNFSDIALLQIERGIRKTVKWPCAPSVELLTRLNYY
eukprot:140873-Amorphochlora_amoeboformis.AAC.1